MIHDNPTLKVPGNLIWPPIVGFGSIVLGFAACHGGRPTGQNGDRTGQR